MLVCLFALYNTFFEMTQPESSRFVFSMRGPNEDLNQFVSLIFLKSAYSYPLLLTLTKDITIGLGPLFHVIVSQSPIFFSLDDLADQLLYCSLNGWFVLSWRMMLNPAVIKEHKGVSMLDSKWIGLVLLGVIAIVGYLMFRQFAECKELQAK